MPRTNLDGRWQGKEMALKYKNQIVGNFQLGKWRWREVDRSDGNEET